MILVVVVLVVHLDDVEVQCGRRLEPLLYRRCKRCDDRKTTVDDVNVGTFKRCAAALHRFGVVVVLIARDNLAFDENFSISFSFSFNFLFKVGLFYPSSAR